MTNIPLVAHFITAQKFYPNQLVPYKEHLWEVIDVEVVERGFIYKLKHFADSKVFIELTETEILRNLVT